MTHEEYNFWLANVHNIGIRKINGLLQYFGCAEEIFKASKEQLMTFMNALEGNHSFQSRDLEEIIQSRNKEDVRRKYNKLRERGIYFVSREDEQYPWKLRNIYDAPFALYVRGRLPGQEEKILAVVGARECTPYGRELAGYFAFEASKEGISVISGLARGIDTYAHEGALRADGISYGILGCGIDICYPKENINVYMELQRKGGVISEYAPGIKPLACNFPMRNRIISGLSDGILLIEAREKSGSLITVDMGLDQGKDIYVLPGRVTDRLSEGCNNMIKMGAKLVTSPKDIMEDMLPNYCQTAVENKKSNKILETNGKIVYACLSLEPMHIEEISVQTGLSMDLIMEQLMILELQGYITQTTKNYYITKLKQ